MALMSPANELCKLQFETLYLEIGIIGSQTQGSIKTFCINNPDCIVYHEDDTRTVTEHDSEIGYALTDLDNDAPPAVLGFLLRGVDAVDVWEIQIVTNSIRSINMSAPATALGTVTLKGSNAPTGMTTKAGTDAAPRGVTDTKHNVAFIAEITSLNIDEDNATAINNRFMLRVTLRKRGV